MFNSLLSKRKGFLFLSLVALVSTLGIGVLLWGSVQTYSLQNLRQQVNQWQPILAFMRCLLIVLLAIGWPYIACFLVKLGLTTDERAQRLTSLRWRVVGWIIVLELVVGQGILVKLLALLAGNNR